MTLPPTNLGIMTLMRTSSSEKVTRKGLVTSARKPRKLVQLTLESKPPWEQQEKLTQVPSRHHSRRRPSDRRPRDRFVHESFQSPPLQARELKAPSRNIARPNPGKWNSRQMARRRSRKAQAQRNAPENAGTSQCQPPVASNERIKLRQWSQRRKQRVLQVAAPTVQSRIKALRGKRPMARFCYWVKKERRSRRRLTL